MRSLAARQAQFQLREALIADRLEHAHQDEKIEREIRFLRQFFTEQRPALDAGDSLAHCHRSNG